MERKSNAPATTRSSPLKGTSKPGSWKSEGVFSASKTCEHCGEVFRPWIKRDEDGNVISMMKPAFWKRQRFCSISCSKKRENAMRCPAARAKMSATLKRIGHQPIVQGGNGRGLTESQKILFEILGDDWIPEHAVPTGLRMATRGTAEAYPTNYKLDLANPKLMIGIELDGVSHNTPSRRAQDQKKDKLLQSFGWRVLRVPNKDALALSTTCKCPDTLLSSLMAYLSTTAT